MRGEVCSQIVVFCCLCPTNNATSHLHPLHARNSGTNLWFCTIDLPPPYRPGRYPARQQRLGAVREGPQYPIRTYWLTRHTIGTCLSMDLRPMVALTQKQRISMREALWKPSSLRLEAANMSLAPSSLTWTPQYVLLTNLSRLKLMPCAANR